MMKFIKDNILIVVLILAIIGVFGYAYFLSLSGSTRNVLSGLNLADLNGVKAYVLDVPYINQYLDSKDKASPDIKLPNGKLLGSSTCGAVSSVMIAAYYGLIKFSSEDDLRSYVYQDRGQGFTSLCSKYGIEGAFGQTSLGSNCEFNTAGGIGQYFDHYKVSMGYVSQSLTFETAKPILDKNNPIIIFYCISEEICHIAVVVGYTETKQLVINDPWTNVGSGDQSWSHKGYHAIYNPDLSPFGYYQGYMYKSN
jgi:Peptidase_C39 like family